MDPELHQNIYCYAGTLLLYIIIIITLLKCPLNIFSIKNSGIARNNNNFIRNK